MPGSSPWPPVVRSALRKGLCEYCGLTYLESIPATGEHVWNAGEVTTPATCSTEGVITYTCEMCGAQDTKSIQPTGEHTWDDGVVTTEPTCSAEGVKTYTCTVCGAKNTQSHPAHGRTHLGRWRGDH